MRSICRINGVAIVTLSLVVLSPLVERCAGAAEFERIDPAYYQTDANSLIDIHGAKGVIAKRRALVKYIWMRKGLPSRKMPAKVEKDITDERYTELSWAGLGRIDKLTIEMDYGLNSIVYHFIPKQPSNKLFIYHQGHRGDFIQGKDTIKGLLDNGYSVMAFSMPLLGMNNRPVVDLERFGKFHLISHDHIKLLKSPIRFFIEPVVVAINYGQKLGYDQVNMIGISGGGWTTTVCAAVDPRIKHSYPVAGTLPFYLRSDSQRDWGDFEQNMPDLYNVANYLELYVLGAFGKGRAQIQLLNKYDSCCFAGIKYRTYEQTMKEVMRSLGEGKFEVFLDDSHKDHKISDESLKAVLRNEGL